ncbi:MAG: hypothetical protein J0H65_07555 [Rhizobiales bacterium]|nr:hypothetical protein [Hyphomicrobiales bacterium]
MGSRKDHSAFTNEELSILKRAFDQACADLELAPDSRLHREHLAVLIFQMATGGESDCERLRRHGVERFRLGTPWQPIRIRSTDVIALNNAPALGPKADPGDKC